MSKALSLKLQEEIFVELEQSSQRLGMPRNAYINKAIDFYNQLIKRKQLQEQLNKESSLVAENSLQVLHEFEHLEDPLDK